MPLDPANKKKQITGHCDTCEKFLGILNIATATLCAIVCMAICAPLVFLINKFAPALKGK